VPISPRRAAPSGASRYNAALKCGVTATEEAAMTGRGLLLKELEKIVANCCRLSGMLRAEHLGYRPQQNMRSMLELVNHLSQIPAVDFRIMQGDTEEQIVALEDQLNREEPRDWHSVMRDGAAALARYIEHLTHDDYENASGTAFYGRTQTNAQWLLEIITHCYHHRAQLFMYMKLNGYDVNTRTLYE
jgi:uncharacterized damage-inducible protein DinB